MVNEAVTLDHLLLRCVGVEIISMVVDISGLADKQVAKCLDVIHKSREFLGILEEECQFF